MSYQALKSKTPGGQPERFSNRTYTTYRTRRNSASQQARSGFAYLLATLPDEKRAELREWLESVKALPGGGGAQ